MSDTISALAGARASGMVELAEAGLQGMITLRGAPGDVAGAVQSVLGADLPGQRRLGAGPGGQVLWMSPDEWLLLVPYAAVRDTVAALETALAGAFATVADVSDARAMIHLTGPQGRDVLAKLCPVDFADFAVGELRRTRAAQVAAALWRTGPESWSLICFRSVAAYLWEALATVSQPGGEVALYR